MDGRMIGADNGSGLASGFGIREDGIWKIWQALSLAVTQEANNNIMSKGHVSYSFYVLEAICYFISLSRECLAHNELINRSLQHLLGQPQSQLDILQLLTYITSRTSH